jgi:hypothetical protein
MPAHDVARMSDRPRLHAPRYVIAVRDLARSARYYADVLGFEVREAVEHARVRDPYHRRTPHHVRATSADLTADRALRLDVE